MDSSTMIAIYLPIIMMFVIIFISNKHQGLRMRQLQKKRRRQKENQPMDYQLVKAYEGKRCVILSNSLSGTEGTIAKVTDGWIEVDTNKSTKLLNLDYISSIEIIKPKIPKNAK